MVDFPGLNESVVDDSVDDALNPSSEGGMISSLLGWIGFPMGIILTLSSPSSPLIAMVIAFISSGTKPY